MNDDQLLLMESAVLTSVEIGKILGQVSKDVSNQLTRIRKQKSKTLKKESENDKK